MDAQGCQALHLSQQTDSAQSSTQQSQWGNYSLPWHFYFKHTISDTLWSKLTHAQINEILHQYLFINNQDRAWRQHKLRSKIYFWKKQGWLQRIVRKVMQSKWIQCSQMIQLAISVAWTKKPPCAKIRYCETKWFSKTFQQTCQNKIKPQLFQQLLCSSVQ